VKAKFYTREEVAKLVGDAHNNPTLEAQLKIYLIPVEKSGFKFCKELKDD